MRRAQRIIAATVLLSLCGALAGCGGGGMSGFDPTDLLDFLDTKKKLPGDRKAVFPEGVPGLQPGVPKELYRGAAPEPAPEAIPTPPPEEPKAKRGSKSRSKSASRAAPAAAPAAEPDATAEEGSTAAAPPAPRPARIQRRRTTAPAADQAAPAAAEQGQPAASSFPAPLPSGGFSR
jgi:pyruvate/2-oxoglutarate dehydrogenase complex dihydrolipoamide acyltransferase (E2) component